MSEIPKAYEPQSVEDKWYDFWQKQGCFTADPARVSEQRPAYSIVIPPPNVTGMLHMGHVLNNTIQDILSRKARMDGKEVLWLPGTDHAGIATESMVSKQIWKEEKKSKRDIGREEFIKRVWTWKEKHGGIIIEQLKKLGCSCDWTRERFTMDPDYVRNVQRVFVDLYKKGLIYRGKRMVNWCPATQTALSDEEVDMKPQKGFMYHFRVEVSEKDAATRKTAPPEIPNPDDNLLLHMQQKVVHATSGDAVENGGPQIDSEGRIWLTIATTRPETIPGDTAVAVNPKDPRYAHLIGKHVIRPLPIQLPYEKKLIPIIGDEHVDFEFGTGVLKVTPAHDKADFEIIERQIRRLDEGSQLERLYFMEMPEVINERGVMTSAAGESLVGLDRFEARAAAIELLRSQGVLVEEKPYENNVGFSQRAGVPIEPRLSEQWFLRYPAIKKSKDCVAEGLMEFHPNRWAKVYDHWLTNIQDWCVSRQLWWGHRIPAWSGFWKPEEEGDLVPVVELAKLKSWITDRPSNPYELDNYQGIEMSFSGKDLQTTFIRFPNERFSWSRDKGYLLTASTISEDEAKTLEKLGFTQDPDVLDTWFSSWLWPFATMGWPEQTPTLKAFYPTTDLVTGPDIIFFWVARMIMAGYEFMGEPKFGLPDAMPFRNVYFTGIIRDKQGRKMSKSLGNSPDPLDLISRYGADALRFGTMRSAPLGQDVLFDEKDVELGRNFCNKLWNACRFRQMVGTTPAPGADADAPPITFDVQGEINPKLLSTDDKWILLKLDLAIREVSDALNSYNFSTAVQALYRFFWSEYCDWYVEASKAVFFGEDIARKTNTLAVIDFVLSHTLRLFHPFMPFITEELWHGLGYSEDMPDDQGGQTIMFAHWPKPLDEDFKGHYGLDDCYLEMAGAKYELVTQGRNLRRAGNIQAGKKVKYVFKPATHQPPHEIEVIRLLLNAETLEINADYQPPKGTPSVRTELGELYLPLEGHLDPAAEVARLKKKIEEFQTEITKVEQKLANPNFTQKVPPQVLAEHQQRLLDWQAKKAQTEATLKDLES